jgi:RhtB (resistance to homoserine/threonine) family protein
MPGQIQKTGRHHCVSRENVIAQGGKMEFWQGFLTITLVHLLAAASPGPDFALVTRQALMSGRRAGFYTSVGIALGLSVHIVYSALGMAALVAGSAEWMKVVKVIGGLYLVFLGIKGLRSRPRVAVDIGWKKEQRARSGCRDILAGALCNVFNPKAPIYFLSLFTIVLSPDLPPVTLCIYGIWIMIIQFLWFAAVTLFFTHSAVRRRFLAIGHWLDRVFGVVMVALGLRVLASTVE